MQETGVTTCKSCHLSMRYTAEIGEKLEWVTCPHCGTPEAVLANKTVKRNTEPDTVLETLNTAPKRKPGVMVSFMDDPELYDLLDEYRRHLGWTWKRLVLVGFANTVARQDDNPDLVVRIADYLTKRR